MEGSSHIHPDEAGKQKKNSCSRELDSVSDNLLNAMLTSIIFFDADGIVFRTNLSAREELHLTDNFVGRNINDLFSIIYQSENILPDLIARLDDSQAEYVTLPCDAFMRSADGSFSFFVSGRITRLSPNEFLFVFRNVVEELTQESLFKMALSSTKIFPWFYDFGRGAMVIDPRYYDYTGIPTRDYTMTLEEFSQRIHPDDRGNMADVFSQQLGGNFYPYPVPFRLLCGDGHYEWFEGQSTYLGQVEGAPYRVVGICMSTQVYKDIEETLTAARDKAEQSDKLKSAFLANMSHEIRTPLNAIVGFSNLLSDGEISADSEEGREFVQLINRNCDYLLALVSEILDLSRIETGIMEYHFVEYSLTQLLSDIHRNFRLRIPEGVSFDLMLPPADAVIETDVSRLRQVLDNLLGNAVKFTNQGRIGLGFKLSEDGEKALLFVEDTGRGISEEQAEKIFDRFYKGDTFVQGVGLGLSICKTITEQMGGAIGVRSHLGEGTSFTLQLPLRHQNVAGLA